MSRHRRHLATMAANRGLCTWTIAGAALMADEGAGGQVNGLWFVLGLLGLVVVALTGIGLAQYRDPDRAHSQQVRQAFFGAGAGSRPVVRDLRPLAGPAATASTQVRPIEDCRPHVDPPHIPASDSDARCAAAHDKTGAPEIDHEPRHILRSVARRPEDPS